MSKLTRHQHWPEQLAAQIAAAQAQPYVIGVHDCARFSCQCIQAMTGVDLWPAIAGYNTRRGAIKAMAQHGPTLEAAAAKLLGTQPAPALTARRGDLLTFNDTLGDHLGVCTGTHVALLAENGLTLLRLDHPGVRFCVRVG
jgi:cell wall-associated NlpC family hydrolase